MSVRFLHTSDWQLGMTRHFLPEGTQERYSQARFDAIRKLGKIAEEKQCRFILVCGDTFESNQVDRKTVARALEALKEVTVPMYFLPGNHDPLNQASVYLSRTFKERKPINVYVIESTDPIKVDEDLEIVGAPWMSKRPAANPLRRVLGVLQPTKGTIRICIAHGQVDMLSPDKESPLVISVAEVEGAINERKIHFMALGDRHSLTSVGDTKRIWYSGTLEPTDFSETQSGFALVVDVSEDNIATEEVQLGQWRFLERKRVDLNSRDDIESLQQWFEKIENKERSIIKLYLVGSISLSEYALLQNHIQVLHDVFGAVEIREEDLHVLPEDEDFAEVGFSGFADRTVQRLRNMIEEGEDISSSAHDALRLCLRLAGGGE